MSSLRRIGIQCLSFENMLRRQATLQFIKTLVFISYTHTLCPTCNPRRGSQTCTLQCTYISTVIFMSHYHKPGTNLDSVAVTKLFLMGKAFNTFSNLEIKARTSCSAAALATTRPTKQDNISCNNKSLTELRRDIGQRVTYISPVLSCPNTTKYGITKHCPSLGRKTRFNSQN